MQWLIKKFFGTKNDRDVKVLRPLVDQVNEIEERLQSVSDEELRAKTDAFRTRLANGETTDDIMCEAFAVVKNACRRLMNTTYDVCGRDRVWDMIPFDVQIIGGIALHQGKIAEMATGEGKTLVATMPVYLNALAGKGVHLVTVNDYLARRDAQWMGLLFEYLGVSVGCIQNQMRPDDRRGEYACDITYGTNSEFGFDYLRDNGLAMSPEDQVQRGYSYAIIDEIDSILIDEARTPLIISGPVAESTHQFVELKPKVERLVRKQRELVNDFIKTARDHIEKGEEEDAALYLYQVRQGMPKHKQLMHMLEEPSIRKLVEGVETAMHGSDRKGQARGLREEMFFVIDERGRDANLTDKGCEALDPSDSEAYVLPDIVTAMADLDNEEGLSEEDRAERQRQVHSAFAEKSERIHNVDQLIRAYCMYEKDVEYVVQDNRVLIVDEFTGRILPGRRWSDGLHQAVEAKEGAKIERETQTLATITIQNFFRMYDKLSGMTGTAETEADEFRATYNLDVIVIPTNRPVRRVDYHDQIFKTQREKYSAIIEDIAESHASKQPVLVGTISVDASELLSRMLRRAGVPHNVLNAKQHEGEADVVARAGTPGAVTIATNMAGRGTDIKLGEEIIHIPREIIESQTGLSDKLDDGRTLLETLEDKPCGLHVIASERHESRRIDRQLRGRCARQGDPGVSRFYVSLEDDLMRLFGSDRISGILAKLGLEEGQALEHKWLNRSIETAQRRVEQQNFAIRKRTLEYDDVMNIQREVVYKFRGDIVRSENVKEHLFDIFWDVIDAHASEMISEDDPEMAETLIEWLRATFPVPFSMADLEGLSPDDAADKICDRVKTAYELKVAAEDPTEVNRLERHIVLQAIDGKWQDYLRSMDALREGVGLRAYGQQDPLIEYKREAYGMFETLMEDIKQEVAAQAFLSSTSIEAFGKFISSLPATLIHDDVTILGARGIAIPKQGRKPPTAPDGSPAGQLPGGSAPVKRDNAKVGRNDPCLCGSGKKYKKCCGAA